jgi:hypothetical protein
MVGESPGVAAHDAKERAMAATAPKARRCSISVPNQIAGPLLQPKAAQRNVTPAQRDCDRIDTGAVYTKSSAGRHTL